MDKIESRLDRLRGLFQDEAFLTNRGLSNEIGIYIVPYAPQEEMTVRHFIQSVREQFAGSPSIRIMFYDLYDLLVTICRERRVFDQLPALERSKGQQVLLKQVQQVAKPEAYVSRMQYGDHRKGDIIVISGAGKVFPYMRSHNILNNLQHLFDDVPVVLFYPGEYDGQQLKLFGKFMDDHYYRAFRLV